MGSGAASGGLAGAWPHWLDDSANIIARQESPPATGQGTGANLLGVRHDGTRSFGVEGAFLEARIGTRKSQRECCQVQRGAAEARRGTSEVRRGTSEAWRGTSEAWRGSSEVRRGSSEDPLKLGNRHVISELGAAAFCCPTSGGAKMDHRLWPVCLGLRGWPSRSD